MKPNHHMVGAEWDLAMHFAPWWAGFGVFLLGCYAVWEWRTAKRDEVPVREANGWPAMLALVALGCIWAGLLLASRDGELPKPQDLPIPDASATKSTASDPSVVARQAPHHLRRVTPLNHTGCRERSRRVGNQPPHDRPRQNTPFA
ncbi:hypothetical protein SGO26_08125 [Cupriavidus metallidurans]|uniref:hypothetical protein n=1 Tax=Cupriavidus TaxID=106589 RepID=UPI0005685231|nr:MULTISPECIES: hypothetical protein [Cupriavidus]HBO77106.1 hypothetical protein [Cupriavidus sp.]